MATRANQLNVLLKKIAFPLHRLRDFGLLIKRNQVSRGDSFTVTTDASWSKDYGSFFLSSIFSLGNNPPHLGRVIREVGSDVIKEKRSFRSSGDGIYEPQGNYEAEALALFEGTGYYSQELYEPVHKRLVLETDNFAVAEDLNLCMNGQSVRRGKHGKSIKDTIYHTRDLLKNLPLSVEVKFANRGNIYIADILSKARRFDGVECLVDHDELRIMDKIYRAYWLKKNYEVPPPMPSYEYELNDASFLETDTEVFAFGSFTDDYMKYMQQENDKEIRFGCVDPKTLIPVGFFSMPGKEYELNEASYLETDTEVLVFGSCNDDYIKYMQEVFDKEIRFGCFDLETFIPVGLFSTELSELHPPNGFELLTLDNAPNKILSSYSGSTSVSEAAVVEENGCASSIIYSGDSGLKQLKPVKIDGHASVSSDSAHNLSKKSSTELSAIHGGSGSTSSEN